MAANQDPVPTTLKSLTFEELALASSKPELVAIPPNISIAMALHIMAKNNILSLPIYSSSMPNKVANIINIFDILRYVVNKLGEERGTDIKAMPDLAEDVQNVLSLDADTESYRIMERDYRDTLAETCVAFTKGVHRCLVTDVVNKKKPHLVSQTDIVRYIATHPEVVRDIVDLNKSIKELGLVGPTKKVVTMAATESALDGIRRMKTNKILALPIVDSEGKILSTLSASDLRGITVEKLVQLCLPVVDYLKTSNNHGVPDPITCIADDTIQEVLDKINKCKVHRVWVVDADKKTVGVVSLSDIIRIAIGQ
ncbi:hypothetical protein HK102_000419 [Quaeritorhiza haematococci]|nr:hypothetical protein HK102_000419 [Quaeritorhiza haematococci]